MSLAAFVHDAVATAKAGDSITLDGSEGHHAVTVRRIRVGEQVALTDGAGTTAVVTVTSTGKKSLVASVVSVRLAVLTRWPGADAWTVNAPG